MLTSDPSREWAGCAADDGGAAELGSKEPLFAVHGVSNSPTRICNDPAISAQVNAANAYASAGVFIPGAWS